MTVFNGLYLLLFGPLELLFEYVYGISYDIIGNPGAAIVPLSLCMNFLALPFYNRADEIQKEERDREKRMAPDVEHIKSVFKGDERYMMLQAYYRIIGYKPIYALRSSLPLLLQIPFFVAAYHFLSNLPNLYGAQFGPLVNLGTPDQLLSIGGISINLLPILMTLINVLSSCIYSKDLSWRDKAQLYGIAAIFLVLLYNSPSGLVFYWTLNQLFSLSKNLVSSVENRKFVICSVLSALGALFLAYAFAIYRVHDLNQLLVIIVGVALQVPSIRTITRKNRPKAPAKATVEQEYILPSTRSFVLGCLLLSILTGLLIPSSVIMSSPTEFVVVTEYQSPLAYVVSAFLLSAGTFIVWLGLFYYLASTKTRRLMGAMVWVLSVVAIIDYMLFATDLGNLSSELKYDIDFEYTIKEMVINAETIVAVSTVLLIIWMKKSKLIKAILSVLIITTLGMSLYNISEVNGKLPQIKELSDRQTGEKASFMLSRSGRNVIVLMLDRAISSYVPYLLQENPDLVKQFDGFTWYPNTLSYGTRTNTGSPALFGGYEYTPEQINKRNTESLVSKQNEALKVMPVLFDEAGFEVTVCDPPYAGYTWIPDLSIYDGYEGIKAYNTTQGQFSDQTETLEIKQQIWERNLFCYSLMKISPLLFQKGIYQDGMYYNPRRMDSLLSQMQYTMGKSVSLGIWDDFRYSYNALQALPEMTLVEDGDTDTFMMMNNDTPHNAILLSEPEYEPSFFVDNTQYDDEHEERFVFEDRAMDVDTAYQMSHYQCNMAALKQVGSWLDYLREEGAYDNTRIIIVADHGWPLEQFEDMMFAEKPEGTIYNPADAMAYNPLLMVKDFDASGYSVDYQFMTNADTPSIALSEIVIDPINPFTGNDITGELKEANEQHVFYTDMWGTESNNGNTFLPGLWFSVKNGNIFDMGNWSYLGIK